MSFRLSGSDESCAAFHRLEIVINDNETDSTLAHDQRPREKLTKKATVLLVTCVLILSFFSQVVSPRPVQIGGQQTSQTTNASPPGSVFNSNDPPSQPVSFVKIWGGASDDYGTGIVRDSAGFYYVVGSSSSFPSVYWNVSILKYNSTGGLVWQKAWGLASNGYSGADSFSSGIALDSWGNIYVTGTTVSRCCTGDHNVFLLKLNSSGSLLWQQTWGSSTYDDGLALAVDSLGNAYVVGDTQLGTIPYFYVALLKYDSSGTLLLQKTWCGACSFSQHATGIAIDRSGYVYVTGWENTYGSQAIDVFLIKLDSSLNGLWAQTWGGTGNDLATGISVDPPSGDIYVTGYTSSYGAGGYDALLLRFSSLTGSLQWQRTWGSGGDDEATGIFVSPHGDIYVTGKTNSFGAGGYDALVLKFDSSLSLIDSQTWGGSGDDSSNAVTVDAAGDAMVTGSVRESLPYSIDGGNQTLHSPNFSLTSPSASVSNATFGFGSLSGLLSMVSGSQNYAGGLDEFVASLPTPSSRAAEFVLAAVPTNTQTTNNYTGPFMIVLAVFNSTGGPVQGLSIAFTLPSTVDATIPPYPFTDSLGVANITAVPTPLFMRSSLFEGQANDGSNIKAFTRIPYGTPIGASESGPYTAGSITLGQVALNSQQQPISGDLTNACDSPFTSKSILQNSCPSATPKASDLVKIACQDFRYAELFACGVATVTIVSCSITATGVLALATAAICAGTIDSLDLTTGICLDYILGAIGQAIHLPLLPVAYPATSVAEGVVQGVGAGCDLFDYLNAGDAGGTASLANGGGSIFIPAHTITSGSIQISIKEIAPWEISNPIPTNFRQTSGLYRVGIGLDQTISHPGQLTLVYSQADVPAGYFASIYHDGNWTQVPSNFNGGNATGDFSGSGDYAVFAAPATATPSLSPIALGAALAVAVAVSIGYRSIRPKKVGVQIRG